MTLYFKSISIIVTILTLFLYPFKTSAQESSFFKATDQFLKKYVYNGLVNYQAIKKQPQEIQQLVNSLQNFDLESLPPGNTQKAFWINVYNLLVIQGVVSNYPIHSPQDVDGFFDRQRFLVAGENLTLNDIENNKIRAVYQDARIHFVLVCAAIGCPSIISNAYLPNILDSQLEERSRVTLNSNLHVRVDHSNGLVNLSELFKWYEEDFKSDGKKTTQFINPFKEGKIPENYEIRYIPYDWRLNDFINVDSATASSKQDNLQSFTPSTLLRPGNFEIKVFNNLYTQTAFFNNDGDKIDAGLRSTFFTGITTFYYGLKPNVNLGFDIFFKSVENDKPNSSPFSVFKFRSGPNTRTTIASIAPKIKISPFKQFRNLAIQTTIVIPIASDLEGSNNSSPYVDYDDLQWWTQLFYDVNLNENFLLYFESGAFLRFDKDNISLQSPVKAFLNYYPSSRTTIYFLTEYGPSWSGGSISSYYSQTGVGAKYQLRSNFEVEGLYTLFPFGKNGGAGQTYNIGFLWIR